MKNKCIKDNINRTCFCMKCAMTSYKSPREETPKIDINSIYPKGAFNQAVEKLCNTRIKRKNFILRTGARTFNKNVSKDYYTTYPDMSLKPIGKELPKCCSDLIKKRGNDE